MAALAFGGIADQRSSQASLTTLTGIFAPIPSSSFHDFLKGNMARFDFDQCKIDAVISLSADFTSNAEIGRGGFKTCHPASLYVPTDRVNSTPLMVPGVNVVLKEFYEKKRNRLDIFSDLWSLLNFFMSSNARARISGELEWSKTMVEANMHFFSIALMEFANAFIERQITRQGM
jgi:hypothetical protein